MELLEGRLAQAQSADDFIGLMVENLRETVSEDPDFITLLFAFFVVMYAVSSVNEGRYRVLSDALSSAFSGIKVEAIAPGALVPITPHGLRHPPAPPPKMTSAQEAHMGDVADRLARALSVLVKDGQVRVSNTVTTALVAPTGTSPACDRCSSPVASFR